MGIFAHRIEQLCPTLWAKLPNAMAEYIVVRDEVLLLTREEILTRLKFLLLQIIQLNIRSTGTACLLGVFSHF